MAFASRMFGPEIQGGEGQKLMTHKPSLDGSPIEGLLVNLPSSVGWRSSFYRHLSSLSGLVLRSWWLLAASKVLRLGLCSLSDLPC